MSHDIMPAGLAGLARHPALLSHALLAKKVEGRSTATLQWYVWAVQSIERFCHKHAIPFQLETLTTLQVRSWVSDMQDQDLAQSTINTHFRALRSVFNWAKQEGLIQKTPFENIKSPKVGKRVLPVFQPEHLRALLQLCPPNTWWGARDRAVIIVLLHTGIRRAELTGLKLYDVDLERNIIKVRGKGDKERRVFLDAEAQRAVLQYMRHRQVGQERIPENDWLFVTMTGRPLTGNAIECILNNLGKRAGVGDVRCSAHTFRHTFAVNFLRAGGDIRYLQETMGHTSMKPLETYLRTVTAEDAIRVHKQICPFKGWGV